MDAADTGRDKIIALETYLDEPAHIRYRAEAEKLLAEIKATETKSRIAEKKQREAEKQRLLLPDLIFVEGGSFIRGGEEDDKETYGDERPRHRVTVADFELGKYPVTVAQFASFVRDSGYRTEAEITKGSYIKVGVGSQYEKRAGVRWDCDASGKTRPESEYEHPVLHVSWYDACAYCNWLTQKTGKICRLPTEAEWEYAAQGGETGIQDGFKYSGSNNLGDVAWHKDNSDGRTHTVGQKKPNRLGLYDMSGNVCEWCEDDWHHKYKSTTTGGQAWVDNPRGIYRVDRGGAWVSPPRSCRVASRSYSDPTTCICYTSFRVAASLSPA
jgi:sulfatase modifying factor 1